MKDTSGNLAIVTALTLGLLGMTTGAAIDFNSAQHSKAKLQAAIDTGVLAAALSPEMEGTENGKTGKAKKIIEAVAKQNLPDGFDFNVQVRVVDGRIEADGHYTHDTTLLRLAGMNEINVKVGSASLIPEDSPIQIALVVDTTASMEGANMLALKAAGNDLLDDISKFSDDAMVSLVPYGQYVNVGLGSEGAAWLDTSRTTHTFTNPYDAGCRDEREVITPAVCSPTGTSRLEPIWSDGSIIGHRDVPEQSCTDPVYGSDVTEVCWPAGVNTRTVNYTFTGCAGSRSGSLNLRADANATNPIPAAMEPDDAPWKARCGEPLTPLTNNLSLVRNSLNALTTQGDTYLASGLMWGWRTLDPSMPFTQSAGADPKTVKAVILMTDGGNTVNQNSDTSQDPGYHYDKNNLGVPGRQHFDQLCTAVKSDGILVFTIGYNLDTGFQEYDKAVQSLRDCASSPGHAFTPDNAAELKATFKNVMLSIREVRLVN